MDQFENYFKRADLDHDGRISGVEAVSFFQGSGLSKQVLAQIWMHADQNRAGFLGRQEFYNALKLVTVAQSKRDLTPEIVKAALYGPASAKIPPPQINLPLTPAPQPTSVPSSPSVHMGSMAPTPSQNLGYRGPVPSNQNMNQQYYPPQANQLVRPSQGPGIPNVELGFSPAGFANSGMRPNLGLVTPALSNSGLSTPGLPSSGISTLGLPNPSMSTPGLPSSGMPTPALSSTGMTGVSTGWLGGRTSGAPSGPTSQLPSSGIVSSTPLDELMSSQVASKGPNGNLVSGNGVSSNSIGGRDPFASFQMTKSVSSPSIPSMGTNHNSSAIVPASAPAPASTFPSSSAIVPVPSVPAQPPSMSRSLDSLQGAFMNQPSGGQLQPAQTYSNPSQPVTQLPSSGAQAGVGIASSVPSQPPWPKMTTPGMQKYTKVFMEVDTDRDGKITGEQARNLFLSWRLPREVLKQVWDLSDQDSDSMLSLREFCIALYLMERYREGRSLPPLLPDSVKFDEILMRLTDVSYSSHGNTGWGPTSGPGVRPVQGMPPSQPMAPSSVLRPVAQSPEADESMQFHQTKPRTSVLDNPQGNLRNDGGQNLFQPNQPETNEAEQKESSWIPYDAGLNLMLELYSHVQTATRFLFLSRIKSNIYSLKQGSAEKVEKVYLDSREKLEYYRTKMQELVLYKSRCDNRLNEIIERASADKREAELLGKKYEEKYKQVAEIASKLTIEEAKFREYQERKMELQQAITNMEQGGSSDGILQVRADRIQSDFEELLKALSERCKKHNLEIKSEALIELPKGWHPGIQEGAAVWDEEWDKFEDEGLQFDKEISSGTPNAKTSPNSTLYENGTYPHDDLFDPDSPSNADNKSEKQSSRGERALDSESGYTHSEDDSVRSPRGSPSHRTTSESPSQDFSDVFARSSEADTDLHRSFDDQGWGNFDGTDEVDSVWGFNSKDQQVDRLFDSSGFGSSPRNDSPQGDNSYNKKSPFNFADSVPATPSFSKSGNSPRYSEAGDGFFDNYSRFDSFNMNESARFSPPRETLTRFDSISSSRSGFGGHNRGFSSFDDSDPFGSTGPFKVSSETPKKSSDNWSSF
ncbi:hypothetical protein KSS87_004194 [Heliosperma pusillum]|nr:hypothetical protein KSS87_004194 [Heliosperma pusillum]